MEKSNKTPCKYGSLIIDPPWRVLQSGTYGAVNHYNLMTVEQIKNMPIADLVDPDCSHCWLWVTAATIRVGYDILEHWGFTPRSFFTWVKPRLGLGNYLRNCAEYLWLGTKGRAPVRCKNQPNWGFFPVQDHSHKPEEIHKIVERVSPGPYAELFARRTTPGWDIWGNEVESDFVIPGYPVPKYSAKATQNTLAEDIPSEDMPAESNSTQNVQSDHNPSKDADAKEV